MNNYIIGALLLTSFACAMDFDGDQKDCLLVRSVKNHKIIALLAPKVVANCTVLSNAFDFKSEVGPPVVSLPDPFDLPKTWEKLAPYLENIANIKKLEKQEDLEEVLIYANYLEHNGLYNACISEWIDRKFDHPLSKFPRELEGAVSNEILRKHSLHNKMISLAVEEITPHSREFECKGGKDVWSCAIQKDDSVAVGRQNGDIHYWRKQNKGWKRETIGKAHENSIGRVQFVEGTNRLISSAQYEGVKVWDLNNKKCLGSIGPDCDGFYSVYDDTRKLLAISSKEFNIHVYSLDGSSESSDSIQPLKVMIGHTDALHAIDFNPKQNMLASSGTDSLLAFWNLDDESLMASFNLYSQAFSISFNHAGTRVAVGLKGDIQLYDTSHFFLVCKNSNAHQKAIWKCVFSSDDSLLITGSEDRNIKIWSVPDLQCLKAISEGLGVILHMEFCDSDQKKLFAGFKNGKAALIDMSRIFREIKENRMVLKYGMPIHKAQFLAKANQSTYDSPLVCEGAMRKVFNSFSKGTRQQLLKHFYLNLPKEEEPVKRGRRGSQKKRLSDKK